MNQTKAPGRIWNGKGDKRSAPMQAKFTDAPRKEQADTSMGERKNQRREEGKKFTWGSPGAS